MKFERTLNSIKIKVPTIGNNINFLYNKISSINNSINHRKIKLTSETKLIKSDSKHSIYNIIKYLYDNNFLNKTLDNCSKKVKELLVDIMENNKKDNLKGWLRNYGRFLMRTLNYLAYKDIIPNELYNNYIDKDLLNEFVDCEIIDYLLTDIDYMHTYKINYKNLNIDLTIYSKDEKLQWELINRVTNLIILIGLYKSNTELINLNIDIFLTNFKKKLNLKEKILGSRQINTGYTSPGFKLCIFRKEELNKVLIHELIHYLNLDLGHFTSGDLHNNYNISPETEIRINEAYTEIFTLMFNSIINSKNKDTLKVILHDELKFSLYQCAKILHYYGFKNAKEFFKPHDCDKFNQTTSVFSYFIVKTILLYNLDDFINNLSKINSKNFKDYIIKNTSLDFIKKIEQFMRFIRNNKQNKEMYNSLRMIYFNKE